MTGIISGIKRMEIHDGDGLRTTVFFKGCPLRCLWCHNPESIDPRPQTAFFSEKCIGCGICLGYRTEAAAETCPTGAIKMYGREYSVDQLCFEVLKDRVFFEDGGGVTLSGGECLMQAEFALSVAKNLKSEGISVYVDTCGYAPRKAIEDMIPYTDKFLYDIKAIDPQVHKSCTGHENRIILENLEYLVERGAKVEIRYPLIVGYNDAECDAIGAYLSRIGGIERVKVLRYHPFASSRYDALGIKNTMPDAETTLGDVSKAVDILSGYGLRAINGASDT